LTSKAKISVKKHKNPIFCQELIRWIEETLHDKLKEIEEKIRTEEEEKAKEKQKMEEESS
jgi:hypothetical protein